MHQLCDKIKMKHILLILASILNVYFVRSQSSCTTPSGGQGRCIPMKECSSLLTSVSKKYIKPQDMEFLTKSHCELEGQAPKVCCPTQETVKQCYTPYGNVGKCVSIYSCQHLLDMLKQPLVQQNIDYVKSSRCAEEYSVCCGPPKEIIQRGNCHNLNAFPPDPLTDCCGLDNTQSRKIIAFGINAEIDQFPWLTLIEYKKGDGIRTLCGGSLISSKYVLTAAHCVTGNILITGTPTNVRLGEYDTSNNGRDCVLVAPGEEDCADPIVTIPIEDTIPHPEYDAITRKNDIALIRLEQNAPYTDFIRPICLPTSDITASPPSKLILEVAGWGAYNQTTRKSNIKLYVRVPFVDMQECKTIYNQPKLAEAELWSKQICAGGEKNRDSCKGDSGGPLMYQNQRIYEAVGLVSYGPTVCGQEKIPAVYTKVYDYISWIRDQLKP
ncbi:phenoloxidase-activating enzyme-like [Achroia grisella]|uniref:phenoloxidase-activating enzyme-like n=1 Tax=Achroia grisella TaxID=688607 RepID=UPI0027D1EE14|nr:phenoloxidase-activating enzyme-like [Achroia grisella]